MGKWKKQWKPPNDMMEMMKVMMTQFGGGKMAQAAMMGGEKPEKIKGTQIKQVKGGGMIRVVTSDGKEFPIDAKKAVYKHLKSIGEEVQMPKAGKSKKPYVKKERTPEEEVAYQAKMAEKHAQTIAKEGRVMASKVYMKGEIVQRGGHFFYVKADNPNAIPPLVKTKLKAMNDELRSKNPKFLGGKDDLAIFCRIGDILTDGLSLKVGTQVMFKMYTDNKGVGGCEVAAA